MLPALVLVATLAAGPTADTLPSAAYLGPSPSFVALTAPSYVAAEGALRLDPAALSSSKEADGKDEPQLVEYSDAYFTRLTIHRWASYLTLPLFVGQYVVGQKLINGEGSDRLRGVHGALAGGIAGLFAVNTVTGGLNLIEARKDPEGKNRRTLHSVLMLLADAGFVATGMLANENENEGGFTGGRVSNNTHRTVALASMGTALVSYAIMLPIFGRN